LARKSLSQNYLTSTSIADKIAQSLGAIPEETMVMEIGGGKGILTGALVKLGNDMICVEIDSSLADKLRKRFGSSGRIKIENKDILEVNPAEYADNNDLYLCGNLPYHISGLILRWISENRRFFPKAVIMLQKEVVARLCGKPGGKEYGVISIIIDIDFNCRHLFDVAANNFSPMPKVDSAVVELNRREKSLIDENNREQFFKLVKTSFSQRRKKLRNTLSGFVDFGSTNLAEIISRAGINPDRRPETLSTKDFIRLFAEINSERN
jgi:16S rRNA (adenine1518-N6/adenine1519-N6)-dimethyltransferase